MFPREIKSILCLAESLEIAFRRAGWVCATPFLAINRWSESTKFGVPKSLNVLKHTRLFRQQPTIGSIPHFLLPTFPCAFRTGSSLSLGDSAVRFAGGIASSPSE